MYKQMSAAQEKTYMELRSAGYEFCQNEENGDVVVGKYDRTGDTSMLLYVITITPDGRYVELDLSGPA